MRRHVLVAGLVCGVAAIAEATTLPQPARADTTPAAARTTRADDAVDLVQVDRDRLYHLEETEGLLIYDVSDADRPRLLGRHPLVGWPLGVAVRGDVATFVMRWGDVRTGGDRTQDPALVRALDVRDPARPRVLGELRIEGDVRDARATRDTLYVLSESRGPDVARVIVTAVRLDGSDMAAPRTVRREGAAGWLRVVDGRVVLAHTDVTRPGTHVDVLTDGPGAVLAVRGTVDLEATVGYGERDTSSRIDATDPAHVRVLGCRTVLCATDDALEIATVDVTDAAAPRVVSTRVVRSPDLAIATRFDGGRLYLSRRGSLSLGTPSTPVVVIDLDGPSSVTPVGQVVDGVVWNLVPVASRLLVIGTRGDVDATRERVFVEAFDVRDARHPAYAGEAFAGDGWTSSSALSSSHAVAVVGPTVAVPFRSWVFPGELRSGVALLDASGGTLRSFGEAPSSGVVERLVPYRGRLLAATSLGLWSIDVDGLRPPRVAPVAMARRQVGPGASP